MARMDWAASKLSAYTFHGGLLINHRRFLSGKGLAQFPHFYQGWWAQGAETMKDRR
jgi:hypothetical protein